MDAIIVAYGSSQEDLQRESVAREVIRETSRALSQLPEDSRIIVSTDPSLLALASSIFPNSSDRLAVDERLASRNINQSEAATTEKVNRIFPAASSRLILLNSREVNESEEEFTLRIKSVLDSLTGHKLCLFISEEVAAKVGNSENFDIKGGISQIKGTFVKNIGNFIIPISLSRIPMEESQDLSMASSYVLLDKTESSPAVNDKLNLLSVRMNKISNDLNLRAANVNFEIIDKVEEKLQTINEIISESSRNIQKCYYYHKEDSEIKKQDFPINIKLVKYKNAQDYSILLENKTNEYIHNVEIRGNGKLILGNIDQLQPFLSTSVDIFIPLSTFSKIGLLSVEVYCNDRQISSPFMYPICEIYDLEEIDNSYSFKIRNNANKGLKFFLVLLNNIEMSILGGSIQRKNVYKNEVDGTIQIEYQKQVVSTVSIK